MPLKSINQSLNHSINQICAWLYRPIFITASASRYFTERFGQHCFLQLQIWNFQIPELNRMCKKQVKLEIGKVWNRNQFQVRCYTAGEGLALTVDAHGQGRRFFGLLTLSTNKMLQSVLGITNKPTIRRGLEPLSPTPIPAYNSAWLTCLGSRDRASFRKRWVDEGLKRLCLGLAAWRWQFLGAEERRWKRFIARRKSENDNLLKWMNEKTKIKQISR